MKSLLLTLLFASFTIAQNLFSEHVAKGKELAAQNNWLAARKEFWAARGEAADEKQNAVAAYRIAQTYRGEGNIDAALDWYKQSIHYFSSKQAEDEMMQLELQRVGKQVPASEIKSALTVPPSDRSPVVEENSIDLDILFDFDKSTLAEQGRAQVHQLALALSADDLKGQSFRITGHTDLVGAPDYNMALSLRRAEAVRSALMQETSLPQTHLKCEGKGMTAPKYQGNSDEANRLNRRVQITALN